MCEPRGTGDNIWISRQGHAQTGAGEFGVNIPLKISDEEAADFALSMSQFERDVITLCSKAKSWRYAGIAKQLNVSYAEVQIAGRKLQASRLAHVSVIPYDGSAIFLNDRGECVKRAVEALARIKARGRKSLDL